MVTENARVAASGISCGVCGSPNQLEFTAEMMIHFKGLANLDKPGVWVFPKLLICWDCGSARFSVPENALALLAQRTPASGRSKPVHFSGECAYPDPNERDEESA